MPSKPFAIWKPQPTEKPTVDPHLEKLNVLSRATECIRYSLLSIEWWISPDGHIREWLRRNVLLSASLIIPAVFVMPVVGFMLWQFIGQLSMLTGKLIVLSILILVAFAIIRLIKR